MGYITPQMAEMPEVEPERVNWESMSALLKDINRSKQIGRLTVMRWHGQGKIIIGRWAKPLTEIVACDDLTESEQAEAQRIMDEMEVAFIHNGIVFYKRDDCPQHFRQYGTGDCTCEPR